MTDRVGQKLGSYHLTRLIGRGAFAEVYLGKHIHLDTLAAVKVLHTQLSQEDIEKFRNEARTLVHLIHPSIVRVLDYGIEGSTPFLVMDYAPNGTLCQRHPRGTKVPLPTVIGYVTQIASALHYAHNEQLIHRDVKPENMLISRHNQILLSDFGIAVVAQSIDNLGSQELAGTIGYMAPEQLQARPRPASDQYALGIVVYEWLSGERPFNGSYAEIAAKHAFIAPPPLRPKVSDLPQAVEAVVQRALEKNPHKRFPTVHDFAYALEQASYPLSELPTGLLPSLPLHQLQPPLHDISELGQPAKPVFEFGTPSASGFTTRPQTGVTLIQPTEANPPWQEIEIQPTLAAPIALATATSPHISEVSQLPTPVLPDRADRPQQAKSPRPHKPARSRQPRKAHKSYRTLWSILATLLTLLVVGSLIAWLALVQHVITFGSVTAPPVSTSPTVSSYPNIAGSYNGSLHNTRADTYAPMTLTIQQDQGTISGQFTVGQPLLGNGTFTGTIDPQKHLRFLVRSGDTSAPILFWGAVQPGGGLSGNYCSVNAATQCDTLAGGRGLWHVVRV